MGKYGKRTGMFRSQTEFRVAAELSRQKVKFAYESRSFPYTISSTYTPDFILPNGIVLEVKGALDAADRRKMIAVRKQHPELDIRFVFQHPGSRASGLKSTVSQWATKNKFQWCRVGEIPSSWLK